MVLAVVGRTGEGIFGAALLFVAGAVYGGFREATAAEMALAFLILGALGGLVVGALLGALVGALLGH
jgi:hypothetical protein